MVHNAMLHYGSASEMLRALTEAPKTRCSQRSQPLEFPDNAMSPSKPSMEAGRKITVGATVRDRGRADSLVGMKNVLQQREEVAQCRLMCQMLLNYGHFYWVEEPLVVSLCPVGQGTQYQGWNQSHTCKSYELPWGHIPVPTNNFTAMKYISIMKEEIKILTEKTKEETLSLFPTCWFLIPDQP